VCVRERERERERERVVGDELSCVTKDSRLGGVTHLPLLSRVCVCVYVCLCVCVCVCVWSGRANPVKKKEEHIHIDRPIFVSTGTEAIG